MADPNIIIIESSEGRTFPLWAAILIVVIVVVLLINLSTWVAMYYTKPRTYVQKQYMVHVKK